MNNFFISRALLVGVLAWGLPSIWVGGSRTIWLVLSTSLPLLWAARRSGAVMKLKPGNTYKSILGVVAFACTYLVLDAFLGREKFSVNLFLAGNAVGSVVDQFNESVSKGRGIIELIGSLLIFLPFALIDAARSAPPKTRVVIWGAGLLLVFYEIGISRGFLMMAVISIALGQRLQWRRLMLAMVATILIFAAASTARGDFQDVAYSNPLFDAVAWPYVNLSLMVESNCGNGQWYEFTQEFLKKFLPAFLIPKNIYSFNIEMTRCIYPMFGDNVQSISIFTYIGEVFYYQPSIVTALIAGLLMAILARHVDVQLFQCRLESTRIFVGLMCIVLLRSRVLDVLSFLIFLSLFLAGWGLLVRSNSPRRCLDSKSITSSTQPGRAANTT